MVLGTPGWGARAVIGLSRGVGHLLLVLVGRPAGCGYRHTGRTKERVVGGSAEHHPLTHVGRVTQNRTGGHLAWDTSDRTPILRQVQGNRVGGLIVIRGRKQFLFLNGHELAFNLAFCTSLASLASGLGRGTLREFVVSDGGRIDGWNEAHFDLTTATLGTGHESPAAATPG